MEYGNYYIITSNGIPLKNTLSFGDFTVYNGYRSAREPLWTWCFEFVKEGGNECTTLKARHPGTLTLAEAKLLHKFICIKINYDR